MTYATLATFTKYPTSSVKAGSGYVGAKKHGFFADDVKSFAEIAKVIGLAKYEHGWKRHPLVFLMEAADDICYRIIDVEDAFKLNRLSFKEADDLLRQIISSERNYSPKWDEGDEISWLRAKAIGVLVKQVSKAVEEIYLHSRRESFLSL